MYPAWLDNGLSGERVENWERQGRHDGPPPSRARTRKAKAASSTAAAFLFLGFRISRTDFVLEWLPSSAPGASKIGCCLAPVSISIHPSIHPQCSHARSVVWQTDSVICLVSPLNHRMALSLAFGLWSGLFLYSLPGPGLGGGCRKRIERKKR